MEEVEDLEQGNANGEEEPITEETEEEPEGEADYDREIRIAIVGKPNVGKVHSLFIGTLPLPLTLT